jgi:hypothetical protein
MAKQDSTDTAAKTTRPRKSPAERAQADFDKAQRTVERANERLQKANEEATRAQEEVDRANRYLAYAQQNPDLPTAAPEADGTNAAA